MTMFAVECVREASDGDLDLIRLDGVLTIVDAANRAQAVWYANKKWCTEPEPGDYYVILPLTTVDEHGVVCESA